MNHEDSSTVKETENNSQRTILNRETKCIPPDSFAYKAENCHFINKCLETFKAIL